MTTTAWEAFELRHSRRAGRTTRQMQDAPAGSVFVWGGGNTLYAKQLAAHLGRDDLEIQPFSWLTPHNVRKGKLPVVIVDHHAVDLAWRQCWAGQARQALEYLRSMAQAERVA